MLLKGSCHCRSVQFQVESACPYPYNLCYCSICRKTAGGGGYAITLGGESDTLKVEGEAHTSIYRVTIDGKRSPLERHFCKHCACVLWIYDPRWPKLVHPFSSAIDSELPVPPERTHFMLGSKASWVEVRTEPSDKCFQEYPEESIGQWHKRLNLIQPKSAV